MQTPPPPPSEVVQISFKMQNVLNRNKNHNISDFYLSRYGENSSKIDHFQYKNVLKKNRINLKNDFSFDSAHSTSSMKTWPLFNFFFKFDACSFNLMHVHAKHSRDFGELAWTSSDANQFRLGTSTLKHADSRGAALVGVWRAKPPPKKNCRLDIYMDNSFFSKVIKFTWKVRNVLKRMKNQF